MKFRFLKTKKTYKGVQTCESLPKIFQWLRVIPPFKDKEVTTTGFEYKLQYRENDHEYFPWIDVPIVEVEE
jgi:hypothetical protein